MFTTPRLTLLATVLCCGAMAAQAQNSAPIKVGLMLPATGTYAGLGTAIENGFKLYVSEHGGKLARQSERSCGEDQGRSTRSPTPTPKVESVPAGTSKAMRTGSPAGTSVSSSGASAWISAIVPSERM